MMKILQNMSCLQGHKLVKRLMLAAFVCLNVLIGLILMWLTTAYYETFWKKLEEMKRDRNELQKRLEQKVQQGQVSYITSPQTGVSILCYISSVYYCIF